MPLDGINTSMDRSDSVTTPSDPQHRYQVSSDSYYYQYPISEELILTFSWLVPVLFGMITVIGVTGNSLVIYVIKKHGQMRTVTNYYIVNLAITDISFLVCCAPFTAALFYQKQNHWLFGAFLCKFTVMMMQVTATSTCLTLAAMSVDRYRTIVRPLESLRNRTTTAALSVNVTIWIVSFVTSFPSLFCFGLTDDGFCVERWPAWKTFYGLYVVIALYILPLTIISACYALMLHKIWRRVVPGILNNDRRRTQQVNRQKRRTTRMILVIVLTFALCWLPVHIFSLWLRFAGGNFPVGDATYVFKVMAHTVSYANSCCNPFIYAFMGAHFKRYFRRMFPSCFAKRRQRDGERSHHTASEQVATRPTREAFERP